MEHSIPFRICRLVRSERLALRNNNTSGWQRSAPCSVSFANDHAIEHVSLEYSAPPTRSTLYAWLAATGDPVVPIRCVSHAAPLYDAVLSATDRMKFGMNCSGKCFPARRLCLVVVAAVVDQSGAVRCEWNSVEGHHRKLGAAKAPPMPMDAELALLRRSVTFLTEEVVRLNERVSFLEQERPLKRARQDEPAPTGDEWPVFDAAHDDVLLACADARTPEKEEEENGGSSYTEYSWH